MINIIGFLNASLTDEFMMKIFCRRIMSVVEFNHFQVRKWQDSFADKTYSKLFDSFLSFRFISLCPQSFLLKEGETPRRKDPAYLFL